MPFDSQTGGFANNTNMGEFIANAVRTFLTNSKATGGLGWLEQTPSGGTGTGAARRFLFSRGTVGSEAPPYWFPYTASKTLWSFTGNGVNTAQEAFDQPGNPMNYPPADPASDIVSGSIYQMTSMGMTTVVGAYDGYWLFGGATAEYFHMVIKVDARQYRHFHVGMLNPLHPDLHADTFYITSHRWAGLAPDDLKVGTNVDREHKPYAGNHCVPFGNNGTENVASGNDHRSQGFMLYSPLYGTDNYDWWLMVGRENSDTANGGSGTQVFGRSQNVSQPGSARDIIATTKTVGDVNNTADSVLFGWGMISGYGDSMGSIPYECEPTFTTDGVALIPYYVILPSDFESDRRYAPVGTVPDCYRVNMKSLDAEQEITIGSDTYVVFPMINKDANNVVAGEGYSAYEGIAYKKITANAT